MYIKFLFTFTCLCTKMRQGGTIQSTRLWINSPFCSLNIGDNAANLHAHIKSIYSVIQCFSYHDVYIGRQPNVVGSK